MLKVCRNEAGTAELSLGVLGDTCRGAVFCTELNLLQAYV